MRDDAPMLCYVEYRDIMIQAALQHDLQCRSSWLDHLHKGSICFEFGVQSTWSNPKFPTLIYVINRQFFYNEPFWDMSKSEGLQIFVKMDLKCCTYGPSVRPSVRLSVPLFFVISAPREILNIS
jgi:hypothetical protein